MKTAIVLLNLISAMLVFPAMSLIQIAQVSSAKHLYVELDRSRVIDRQQLEKIFPAQAKNDRNDIPLLFVAQRKIAWVIGYPCIAGFVLNALIIGIFMERKSKASR